MRLDGLLQGQCAGNWELMRNSPARGHTTQMILEYRTLNDSKAGIFHFNGVPAESTTLFLAAPRSPEHTELNIMLQNMSGDTNTFPPMSLRRGKESE